MADIFQRFENLMFYFVQTEVCSQQFNTDSGDGLVLNKQQASTWTDDDQVVSPGLDVLESNLPSIGIIIVDIRQT